MSEERLPPYTYTPGVAPHPISDPAGHSYGRVARPITVDAEQLGASPVFRRAIQLFQDGYYWEAHEEWESIWHALGRRGASADFVKGLIKLAAAGVKAREGNTVGVQRHLRRAVELLSAASTTAIRDVPALTECASALAGSTTSYPRLNHGQPVIFWPALAGELDRL
jgi:hypothetical protein